MAQVGSTSYKTNEMARYENTSCKVNPKGAEWQVLHVGEMTFLEMKILHVS